MAEAIPSLRVAPEGGRRGPGANMGADSLMRLSAGLLVLLFGVMPVHGQSSYGTAVPLVSGGERAVTVPCLSAVGHGAIPASGSVTNGALQAKPDLTVLDTWTVPGDFCPEAVVDVYSTIHNLGAVAVVDSFYFDMWFDGENIGYARLDGLGAGESLELVLEDFMWPADSDSHVVTAMADTDHEIDEELETNNIHLEYLLAEVCTTCTEVSIPFESGWNWFSLNLSDADMSLDYVLASLDTNGIYIKNQTAFADYVALWGGWFGTLGEIDCRDTYMIKLVNPDTLIFCGFPYDVSAPMALPAGWSWISYLPRGPLALDDALSSLGDHGEYIKDQTAFADYVPEWNGWFGTLTEMHPLGGYKIKMAGAAVLVYPDAARAVSDVPRARPAVRGPALKEPGWLVDPHHYEKNACMIATVSFNGATCVGPDDRLAAFCGGECRGWVSALLNPAGVYCFYLTFYGSAGGRDVLTFRYWDARSGVIRALDDEVVFEPDLLLGSSIDPVVMNAGPEPAASEAARGLPVYLSNKPDPFAELTAITFQTAVPGRVELAIFDVQGERTTTLINSRVDAGTHTFTWDGRDGSGRQVPSGVYFCRLEAGDTVRADKIVLMR